MLLALDVGNTHVTLGLFRGRRLVAWVDHPTAKASGVGRTLRAWLRGHGFLPNELEGVILSSVVPRATGLIRRALRHLVPVRPLVLGQEIQAPIVNRYRVPGQVGQDRLVNGVAAYTLYGGPVIVVDFGTAVTVDLISARREYLGGLIVPGIRVGMEALIQRAALLPEIKLEPPRQLLGQSTRESMRSGIFFGYSALCDGLVQRLRRRYAPRARVVATGGDARRFAPYCRTVQIVNPYLTLQGLELTYREENRSLQKNC